MYGDNPFSSPVLNCKDIHWIGWEENDKGESCDVKLNGPLLVQGSGLGVCAKGTPDKENNNEQRALKPRTL